MIIRKIFHEAFMVDCDESYASVWRKYNAARDKILRDMNAWYAAAPCQILSVQEERFVGRTIEQLPYWAETVVYFMEPPA